MKMTILYCFIALLLTSSIISGTHLITPLNSHEIIKNIRTLHSSDVEEWNATFGGEDDDKASVVQQTDDGGYIIGGYTRSYGAGKSDAWLVRTDSNGTELWNKTYGTYKYEDITSIDQTTDGGFIFIGYKQIGSVDSGIWLVKVNETGDQQWQKTFGIDDSNMGKAVQQTSDGGYIILGSTTYYGTQTSDFDFWLIKTDKNGTKEWDKLYGGIKADFANSLDQTTDQGYILAGYTKTYTAGGKDVWVVKTTSNGTLEWHRTYGGINDEDAKSIKQTDDGGFIVAGSTSSSGAGMSDVWLLKIDSDGNRQWDNTFGGSDRDVAECITQIDNGYIMVGWTRSFGAVDDNLYIIKTNKHGKKYSELILGGPKGDKGFSIQQTSDGKYIIAGYFNNYLDSYWIADTWLIKINTTPIPIPNLQCTGTISLTDVKPGSKITGTFTIENIGDPNSLLDWEISDYPFWGSWGFLPSYGHNLLPGDIRTAEIFLNVPNNTNTDFNGTITVINKENPSDLSQIQVAISTSTTYQSFLGCFLQRFVNQNPLLDFFISWIMRGFLYEKNKMFGGLI